METQDLIQDRGERRGQSRDQERVGGISETGVLAMQAWLLVDALFLSVF